MCINKLEIRTCSVTKMAYLACLLIVDRLGNTEQLTRRTVPLPKLLMASF